MPGLTAAEQVPLSKLCIVSQASGSHLSCLALLASRIVLALVRSCQLLAVGPGLRLQVGDLTLGLRLDALLLVRLPATEGILAGLQGAQKLSRQLAASAHK